MTTAVGEAASVEIGHYWRILRRRFWVVLLCGLLGLAAAVAYLALAERAVTATTVVNLNVISSDPFSGVKSAAELIDPATEAQIVNSTKVLEQAAGEIGGGATPSEVRSDMSAKLVPDATVVRVSYQAGGVSDAEAGADAVAKAYLDYRSQQAADRVTAIVDQLEERRSGLRDDLVRINTIAKTSSPNSPRAVQAESDRQLTNIELNSLSSQINDYLGLDTTGGTVLSAAAQNPTSVSPSKAVVVTTGTALGLVVGVLLAFVIGAASRSVDDEYDVRRAGGGQVLGALGGSTYSVPAQGADLDTIRSVRELLLSTLREDPPVVAVADLSSGKPVVDVAANLAYVVAETGREVQLVMPETDLELASQTAEQLGLTQASRDGRTFRGGNLSLLVPDRSGAGVGTPWPTPAHDEHGASGLTVFAAPHTTKHSFLLEAGRLGHAVVLVVARRGTRRTEITRTSEELALVGARVHGSVLVRKGRKPARSRRP